MIHLILDAPNQKVIAASENKVTLITIPGGELEQTLIKNASFKFLEFAFPFLVSANIPGNIYTFNYPSLSLYNAIEDNSVGIEFLAINPNPLIMIFSIAF